MEKNHHVSRYLSFDIICIFVGAQATLFGSPFCLSLCVCKCECDCVWRPTFQSRWRWPTNELSAACSKKQDLFRVFALPRLPLLTSYVYMCVCVCMNACICMLLCVCMCMCYAESRVVYTESGGPWAARRAVLVVVFLATT